jgi:hypothetical protein
VLLRLFRMIIYGLAFFFVYRLIVRTLQYLRRNRLPRKTQSRLVTYGMLSFVTFPTIQTNPLEFFPVRYVPVFAGNARVHKTPEII